MCGQESCRSCADHERTIMSRKVSVRLRSDYIFSIQNLYLVRLKPGREYDGIDIGRNGQNIPGFRVARSCVE
jgi:hypothetical protein